MTSKQRLSDQIKKLGNKIDLTLGEFNNLKQLGEGGNSIVYAATLLDKQVAIKFLLTEETGDSKKQKEKRFLAEYLHIVMLEGKISIVQYIDYDFYKLIDEEGELEIPVIVMNKYESSLKVPKPPTKKEFKRLFDFLIKTVGFIHKNGIIHRDLKPENILVKDQNFYLADFGIAAYNPEMFKPIAITEKDERIGNRIFSAPEQEKKGFEAHPTMDIYAIGQILQWFATGNTHRGTGRERISSVLSELEIYENIIEKCLFQNPKSRFQSIQEIIEFMERSIEKDAWYYLDLFNEICRSNFPNNELGIIYCRDRNRIDKFFNSLKDKEEEFGQEIWWISGYKSSNLKLKQNGNGVWKSHYREFDIDEMWVHHDDTTNYEDFVLLHFKKGEPFVFEGRESYYGAFVDKEHQITISEADNGFAEINGDVLNLSNHEVDKIHRNEKEGYLFIGTKYNCIILPKNDQYSHTFIEKLLLESRKPTIPELGEFAFEISREKHPEVQRVL